MHEKTEVTLARYLKDGEQLKQDIAKLVEVNINDVLYDMEHLPSQYSHWSHMQALAEQMEERYKQSVKTITAHADAAIRAKLAKEGIKVTESLVANAVVLDEGVMAAQEKYTQWAGLSGLLKAAVSSLWSKRDMLQNINQRQCREYVAGR